MDELVGVFSSTVNDYYTGLMSPVIYGTDLPGHLGEGQDNR